MSLIAKTIDEIWLGDHFDRRVEAENLQAFIESAGGRDLGREDAKAYTIAVDAGYGIGKTFFLKRLAQQLELTHPVAFVDAWADDLADEPLVALASTLKEAFEPLTTADKVMARRVDVAINKIGIVGKAVMLGALKRGASYLIGEGAAGVVGDALGDAFEAVKDDAKDAIHDGADDILDKASEALEGAARKGMADRIREFRETKTAVKQLKRSLADLVSSLEETRLTGPVVIIVDELDRCRPTYAVKVLEEIKHLFDVQGLVFVFGVHGDQLAHSVAGAYGPNFDGRSYLMRFIDRTYRLAQPELSSLLNEIFSDDVDLTKKFYWPDVFVTSGSRASLSFGEIVAMYMEAYGLGPRDAYGITDTLRVCAALTGEATLILPYLLPFALNKIRGQVKDHTYRGTGKSLTFAMPTERDLHSVSFNDFSAQLYHLAADQRVLHSHYSDRQPVATAVFPIMTSQVLRSSPLANLARYPDLLEAVGRFSPAQTK